jgi:ATP-dependent Clp protease adaptor protein ClpS
MGDYDTGTKSKTTVRTERPRLHKVLLLNDDYTPREFVVTCCARSSAWATTRPTG